MQSPRKKKNKNEGWFVFVTFDTFRQDKRSSEYNTPCVYE